MNAESAELIEKIVGSSYRSLGLDAKRSRENEVNVLLRHRKLPEVGWDDASIELFLYNLSQMDCNNFRSTVGVGEREGRCYSDIVKRRHLGLCHGIGRSGDITALQPKAVGSSLINRLTNSLVLHAIQISGITSCKACFVVPCATGMAMMLCLQYFQKVRPSAKHVIWSRIDQKSCIKCILALGLKLLVVEQKLENDILVTNLTQMEQHVATYGPENILCIVTTTSCFGPRNPDRVAEVARLCAVHSVPHMVNNAYGLQCDSICKDVNKGASVGRIDAFVQSTDKNFMVPVSGAIIAGFDEAVVKAIAEIYPGRGSSVPSVDLLITLLSMGKVGYLELLQKRKDCFAHLRTQLSNWAQLHGERLLPSTNPISFALSLERLDQLCAGQSKFVTELGSMIFRRNCSGCRVVPKRTLHQIESYSFVGWGAHHASSPCSYLNVAAAIGMEKHEVDRFMEVLNFCFQSMLKKQSSLKE